MVQAARQRLAGAQADLVRALVAQGPIPAGFDERALRIAARSLVNKRRQALARAWPSLVESLGNAFVESFTRYAVAHPLPACAHALADGREFLRWLNEQEAAGDAARLEALAFDLRWVVTPAALLPRRGFALRSVRLTEKPGRIVGVRLPWLGVRRWRI